MPAQSPSTLSSPVVTLSDVAPRFPSVKWRDLQRILCSAPLNYSVHRQRGSHRILKSPGRPDLLIAGHDGETCSPGLVKKILTKDVGLTEDEARALL